MPTMTGENKLMAVVYCSFMVLANKFSVLDTQNWIHNLNSVWTISSVFLSNQHSHIRKSTCRSDVTSFLQTLTHMCSTKKNIYDVPTKFPSFVQCFGYVFEGNQEFCHRGIYYGEVTRWVLSVKQWIYVLKKHPTTYILAQYFQSATWFDAIAKRKQSLKILFKLTTSIISSDFWLSLHCSSTVNVSVMISAIPVGNLANHFRNAKNLISFSMFFFFIHFAISSIKKRIELKKTKMESGDKKTNCSDGRIFVLK